jgi:hypothetical protein
MTHPKQAVVGVPKEPYQGETLVALIASHMLDESAARVVVGF